MSEMKALQDQFRKLSGHAKRQEHHIISQKRFIDSIVNQNIALDTSLSIQTERVKQLNAVSELHTKEIAALEEKLDALEERIASYSDGVVEKPVDA